MRQGIQVTVGLDKITDLRSWQDHLHAKGIKTFVVEFMGRFELWREISVVTNNQTGIFGGELKAMIVPAGAKIIEWQGAR